MYYGYGYINPIVCSFGIICNMINLTVLFSPRLKESPYIYLTFLASFDLLTLLFTLSLTLTRGFLFQHPSQLVIQYYLQRLETVIFIPSANLFSALSVSITVALTVERYLFTKFPMKVSNICSVKNARRIIMCIVPFVFLFRLPMYFFSDAQYEDLNKTAMNYSTSLGKIISFNLFELFFFFDLLFKF
jgi:hypothetical protein